MRHQRMHLMDVVHGVMASRQEARLRKLEEAQAKSDKRNLGLDGNGFVSGKELAQRFGVHPKTIERWRKTEGLPCRRLRGSVLYQLGDVRRWVEQRKEG